MLHSSNPFRCFGFARLFPFAARIGARAILLALLFSIVASDLSAQKGAPPAEQPASDPAQALAETLTAACKHDEAAFAGHLTSDTAEAYRALAQDQRVALLKRLVLLDDPGRPLLSSSQGHTVVRCEGGGLTSEMRFGATEVRENLAFVPVTVPEGTDTQSVRFGLVREAGQWKLVSVGLLLLDIPAMSKQWEESDLQGREKNATALLRTIAAALISYQSAYGNLPEGLEQLGPPAQGGVSPEAAGLVDSKLAGGLAGEPVGGYRLRYAIVPASGEESQSERNRGAGFSLAAMPAVYGKDGRRSFFLDASGTLRGADKNGAVATADDPPAETEELR